MFQLDWANRSLWEKEKPCPRGIESNLRPGIVKKTMLLHWEEHCLECAIPYCYAECTLYRQRRDLKCARFVYGIYPNRDLHGLFDFGADVRYRRWGTLDSEIYTRRLSVFQHKTLQKINSLTAASVNLISDVLLPVSPGRRLNSALSYFREKLFEKTQTTHLRVEDIPETFVLECFLPEGEQQFGLILEYHRGGEVRFRNSFDIRPGLNFYTLPTEKFNIVTQPPAGRIRIYPDNNAEPRVIFTWLDFVTLMPEQKLTAVREETAVPKAAPKVKCVAWDLDNTLWEGTLLEDGMSGLRPRSEALSLIKKLDERGIIQTVASKNNYDEAWRVVERLGLQDYFIYPAIHWGPKSGSLKEIAEQLNININTFALIDDSPFEREEVKSALPQVRVYSEEQITELLNYDEFDVPVTETSRLRRLSYLAEVKRRRAMESFSSDYEGFLRSCRMELRIFVPEKKGHILRCLELIQRSNQLNLSARRYTEEQFRRLLSDEGMLNVAFSCRDRFGDYGIIGFASVNEREKIPVLLEFVLSCRAAQKRVEHTFIKWLARREAGRKKSVLRAALVDTRLNKPLFKVFEDLPFRPVQKEGTCILMELPVNKAGEIVDVMELEADLPNGADYQRR